MILFPHGKINLGLHVTTRREDGFHDIETCFYPVRGLRDAVELLPDGDRSEDDSQENSRVEFSSSGLRIDCPARENLCVKTYNLLRDAFPQSITGGIRIHLHKSIPFGSGLGGGSADATAVLRGMNECYDLGLSPGELTEFARRLGSDTAFFLYDTPMLGTGRGEILNPVAVDLDGWWLQLVKPDVGISTAEAYAAITPKPPEYELESLLQRPVEEWRGKLANHFEGPVFEKLPKLYDIRENLYHKGAVYAAMSGSGSAVYGLFREKPVVFQRDWERCFVHVEQL